MSRKCNIVLLRCNLFAWNFTHMYKGKCIYWGKTKRYPLIPTQLSLNRGQKERVQLLGYSYYFSSIISNTHLSRILEGEERRSFFKWCLIKKKVKMCLSPFTTESLNEWLWQIIPHFLSLYRPFLVLITCTLLSFTERYTKHNTATV